MVSFKIGHTDSSNFEIFFTVVLAVRVSLPFPLRFRVILSIFTETSVVILLGIALSLFISIGRIDIFYSAESSACEHGMSLRLLGTSLISFSAFCSF